jgi:F-type H+-transporting ATPase subunit epsilon
MSEKTQRLEIVTPQKKVFSEDVRFVVAPGVEGELGILPDHAPLISALAIGVLRIQQEGKNFKVFVNGGFMEVINSRVTVIANSAERAENIDMNRAEAARQRAEQRLAAKTPEIDLARAELALKRALTRLKAAK